MQGKEVWECTAAAIKGVGQNGFEYLFVKINISYIYWKQSKRTMDQDASGAEAEKVRVLYEQIAKEKGALFEDTIAPLQKASLSAVQRQYYLKVAISFFFLAVLAFSLYWMIREQDYDPRFFFAMAIFLFLALAIRKEALQTKRLTLNHAVKGVVTNKTVEYYRNLPLHSVILSQKKKIRVTADQYPELTLGDIAEITYVKADDPTLPITVRKLGSILQDNPPGINFQTNKKQPLWGRPSTLTFYFGRFALAILLVNAAFLIIYATRTVINHQYVERYDAFYGILAVLTVPSVYYFLVHPLVLDRNRKLSTRIGAVVYFCFGALFSTTPLLISMDHFLVKVKMVESPETFGPGEQQYFMFNHYYLHRKLQYDSAYYRYDRGARGQSPRDELNYFTLVPLSKSREDTTFSLFLYWNSYVSQPVGSKEDIELGLRGLYAKEHKKMLTFPFDSITYFDRSDGGTLTKSTLGELLGDRVSEMPFRSTPDAVLLVPYTDEVKDEGASFLLGYVIVFAIFMLFSFAFT